MNFNMTTFSRLDKLHAVVYILNDVKIYDITEEDVAKTMQISTVMSSEKVA